jgi:hypothetical protein
MPRRYAMITTASELRRLVAHNGEVILRDCDDDELNYLFISDGDRVIFETVTRRDLIWSYIDPSTFDFGAVLPAYITGLKPRGALPN